MTNEQLTQNFVDLDAKATRCIERINHNTGTLKEVQAEQKEQRRLLVVIERIASGLETVKKEVGNISARLCRIEEKPGKRWESISLSILLLFFGGLVGFILRTVGIA